MVELVLDHAGQQAIDVEMNGLAVERPGIDHDPLRPPHVHPHTRQAEAALFLDRGASRPAEHGIDEHMLLAVPALAFAVHDEQPIGSRHLIGREAYTAGVVHDVEHLLNGRRERVVDPRHGFGPA